MTPIKTALVYFFAITVGALLGLAFAVAITVLTSPSAEANHHPDPTNYCNVLAQFAWHTAELRDAGYPIDYHAPYLAKIQNSVVQQDAITIVRSVYRQPFLDPASEATIAFDFCYRIHGA